VRVTPALLCNRLVSNEPIVLPQVQFSLLSKGPEQLETLAICRDLGITVIAYSPLGLGAHRLPTDGSAHAKASGGKLMSGPAHVKKHAPSPQLRLDGTVCWKGIMGAALQAC
jgi:aryl-alcohol dehydrogenase-like predicted oxidoreductase